MIRSDRSSGDCLLAVGETMPPDEETGAVRAGSSAARARSACARWLRTWCRGRRPDGGRARGCQRGCGGRVEIKGQLFIAGMIEIYVITAVFITYQVGRRAAAADKQKSGDKQADDVSKTVALAVLVLTTLADAIVKIVAYFKPTPYGFGMQVVMFVNNVLTSMVVACWLMFLAMSALEFAKAGGGRLLASGVLSVALLLLLVAGVYLSARYNLTYAPRHAAPPPTDSPDLPPPYGGSWNRGHHIHMHTLPTTAHSPPSSGDVLGTGGRADILTQYHAEHNDYIPQPPTSEMAPDDTRVGGPVVLPPPYNGQAPSPPPLATPPSQAMHITTKI